MPGSKTIPGFAGASQPPPAPDGGSHDEPQTARTVMGHSRHLVPPPDMEIPKPAAAPRVTPAVARDLPQRRSASSVAVVAPDEVTERIPAGQRRAPSHTGKSGFPALARLFGRWTTGGGFLSRSRMSDEDSDPLTLPRNLWVRPVVFALVMAAIGFLLVIAVVNVRACGAPDPASAPGRAAPTPKTRVQAPAAPAGASAAPVAPARLPLVPPPPAPEAPPTTGVRSATATLVTQAPGSLRPPTWRPARRSDRPPKNRGARAGAASPTPPAVEPTAARPGADDPDSVLPLSDP